MVREKELSLDDMRAGILNAMNASASEKTRMSNLQTRVSQIDEQDTRALKDKQELTQKLGELSTQLVAREHELEEILSRKSASQEEKAQVSERLEQALLKKKSVETGLNETKNRLAAQNSRLRSLIELEQSLEGYQKGVRTVMSAKKEGSAKERLGTIHGLVADMIETEPQYEVAIEAVLGDRLQYVVVDSQHDSLKAIDYLKAKSGGRSTFIPKTPREIKTEPFVKNGHAGVIGSALNIVRYNENYGNVAQYLLGDVVVVDTMDTALYLWQKNGIHKTIVTLTGEILDPWGAVTGGTIEAVGTGMLTKRREIKDLEHEIAGLTVSAAKLEAELSALDAAIESDRRIEADLSQQIHSADLEFVNREKDRLGVREEISRNEGRIKTLDAEASERTVLRSDLNAQIAVSSEALRELEAGHSSAQANIESLQTELSAQKETREAAVAGITEIKMEIAALQEKQSAASRGLITLVQTEAELADRLAKRETEITAIAVKLGELDSLITEAEAEIKGHIEILESERKVLVSLQEAHSVKNQALQTSEEQARQIRNDSEAAQKRLSSNEVKRTELRMKIEHLKDRIWSTYHAELESVVTELGQFEINLEEATLQLDEYRQKIDQMGPINVDALQEYNEHKERYDLLSGQQADINDSINNLKATIAKLDGETIELFTEAFHSIQEKFKEVFALLFEGGRAEIVLLEPENILESGIEIIAQPRGKKFQSITLLSGGERALTAIALLVRGLPGQTEPLLHARRSRRPAR